MRWSGFGILVSILWLSTAMNSSPFEVLHRSENSLRYFAYCHKFDILMSAIPVRSALLFSCSRPQRTDVVSPLKETFLDITGRLVLCYCIIRTGYWRFSIKTRRSIYSSCLFSLLFFFFFPPENAQRVKKIWLVLLYNYLISNICSVQTRKKKKIWNRMTTSVLKQEQAVKTKPKQEKIFLVYFLSSFLTVYLLF